MYDKKYFFTIYVWYDIKMLEYCIDKYQIQQTIYVYVYFLIFFLLCYNQMAHKMTKIHNIPEIVIFTVFPLSNRIRIFHFRKNSYHCVFLVTKYFTVLENK
jgi:hypothetical protein